MELDVYTAFGTGWLVVNILFGFASIAVGIWAGKRYAHRMENFPVLRRLWREVAGHNLASATDFLRSLAKKECDTGEADTMTRSP